MRSADIKPRSWYTTEKKYGSDDTFLLLDTERYTIRRVYGGATEVWPTPDSKLHSGRSWYSTATGFLAVEVYNDAQQAMIEWAENGADPQKAPAAASRAAQLLDAVVDAMNTTGGRVDPDALGVDSTDMRVIVVQPREVAGDFVALTQRRRDERQRAQAHRRERERAEQERRDFLVATLGRAKNLGLTVGQGGAEEGRGYGQRFSTVQMPAGHYAELIDEIARLRDLVIKTVQADEGGESDATA